MAKNTLERRFAERVAAREWADALYLRDRNDGPGLLDEWRSELTTDELRIVLPHVWQAAEFPVGDDDYDEDYWIGLWREAGFVSTGGNAAPTASITVYRGASAEGVGYGLSWTRDSETARWFARRWTLTGTAGGLFELQVPPIAVLALIDSDDDRREHEVVVDMGGLGRPLLVERFPIKATV